MCSDTTANPPTAPLTISNTRSPGTVCDAAGTDSAPGPALWDQVLRLRAELAERSTAVAHIERRFRQDIQPREQRMTALVCQLCERLIALYRGTPLDLADRSLLGLWITDTLQSLQQHPFADATIVEALGSRWLSLLTQPGDLVDSQLALAASQRLTPSRRRDTSRQADVNDDPAAQGEAHRDGAPGYGEHGRAAGGATEGTSGGTADGAAGYSTKKAGDGGLVTDRQLVDYLFRKLARVLHPDRDTDEHGKTAKHALMSECLKARDENDLATLLAQYQRHIGRLPDSWYAEHRQRLERALHGQLFVLRRQLLRCLPHDALQRQIIERYLALQSGESDRRIERHRDALDREASRLTKNLRALDDASGLRELLDERRELELDRRVLDELTGAGPG